jgi:hypothetical protein
MAQGTQFIICRYHKKISSLDWMVGSQSQCLQHVIQVESNNDVEEENDKGPSYHQVLEPQEELTDPGEDFYGCISENKTQIIGPQGTSIGRRSPRVSRIPYKSGQLFSHFLKEYTVFFWIFLNWIADFALWTIVF